MIESNLFHGINKEYVLNQIIQEKIATKLSKIEKNHNENANAISKMHYQLDSLTHTATELETLYLRRIPQKAQAEVAKHNILAIEENKTKLGSESKTDTVKNTTKLKIAKSTAAKLSPAKNLQVGNIQHIQTFCFLENRQQEEEWLAVDIKHQKATFEVTLPKDAKLSTLQEEITNKGGLDKEKFYVQINGMIYSSNDENIELSQFLRGGNKKLEFIVTDKKPLEYNFYSSDAEIVQNIVDPLIYQLRSGIATTSLEQLLLEKNDKVCTALFHQRNDINKIVQFAANLHNEVDTTNETHCQHL